MVWLFDNLHTNVRCGEICSHVDAVLFEIEDAVLLEYASESCAYVLCQWNK